MKINELLLVAPNRIEKRSRTIDAIADDEVIIKVVSCGLCSSEFPVITGETEGQPGVSYRYKSYPCNLGHEVSGIIFEVGNNVRDFQLGDRVTGLAYYGSGFSDYVVAPKGMLIKVPKDIPLEFALGEPVMAAVNAAEMSDPFSNANSLFIGDGFMSLMTIAALSEYSQQKITVVGHHENRLSVAKDLGATHTLNAKNTDVYWEIRNLIDQDKKSVSQEPWEGGVDIAFEFTGKMSNLQLCASLCKAKSRAKLMMTSYYKPEKFTLGHYLINRAPVLMPSFPNHSINVLGQLDKAISIINKNINSFENIVTHAFCMEDLDTALEYAYERKDGFIKGIITPDFELLESNVKRVI